MSREPTVCSSMTIRSRPRRSMEPRVPQAFATLETGTSISRVSTCIGVKSSRIHGSWISRWTSVRGRTPDHSTPMCLAPQTRVGMGTLSRSTTVTIKSVFTTTVRFSRRPLFRGSSRPPRIGKRSSSTTSEDSSPSVWVGLANFITRT